MSNWITLKNGVHLDLDNLTPQQIEKFFGSKQEYEEAKAHANFNKQIREKTGRKTNIINNQSKENLKEQKYGKFIDYERIEKQESDNDLIKNCNLNDDHTGKYDNNCSATSIAYVMRKLGYDVTAKPINAASIVEIASVFGYNEKEINNFPKMASEDTKINKMFLDGNIKQSGSGTYFVFISKMYKDELIGHVIVAENEQNKINYIDTQYNEYDVDKSLNDEMLSYFIMKIDSNNINEDLVDNYVEKVKIK